MNSNKSSNHIQQTNPLILKSTLNNDSFFYSIQNKLSKNPEIRYFVKLLFFFFEMITKLFWMKIFQYSLMFSDVLIFTNFH